MKLPGLASEKSFKFQNEPLPMEFVPLITEFVLDRCDFDVRSINLSTSSLIFSRPLFQHDRRTSCWPRDRNIKLEIE